MKSTLPVSSGPFPINKMTLRQGLIAFLYKPRWDIERTLDELKNKLREAEAWASSPTAKIAQAQVICLTHNLRLRVEAQLKVDGIEKVAEIQRKAKELAKAVATAAQAGRKIPSPVIALQRLTQRSVKLLRCPRSNLLDRLVWPAATPRRAALYAEL